MGEQALNLAHAFAAYQHFASLPEIGFCAEPADCTGQLRRRLAADVPARLLTDAYLAAFAESAGLRMVTFDKDFERFEGLDRLHLIAAGH